jgi:alkanesulfonate monooxygenase SsuD/methylene tetrahydromethanopterin reductase-like flavin-dependent oxidoreductase (luciferase family)
VQLYRDSFRPSPVLERPYAIVTANVLTAETGEEATRLALPGQLMRLAIRTNRLRPLPSPEEAAVDPERAAAEAMPSNAIVGTPDVAVAGLRDLAERTGADELMISASTHGVRERVRNLELVARAWGLRPDRERAAA